jgi:hypothetical protein
MKNVLLNDQKSKGLLHRIQQDMSVLGKDFRDLVSHTALEVIPCNAKDLANQAARKIKEGGAYATSKIRTINRSPQDETRGWVGGALVVGLLSMGIYAIYRAAGHEPANVANAEAEPMIESLGI